MPFERAEQRKEKLETILRTRDGLSFFGSFFGQEKKGQEKPSKKLFILTFHEIETEK